jgi:hypothetical protein
MGFNRKRIYTLSYREKKLNTLVSRYTTGQNGKHTAAGMLFNKETDLYLWIENTANQCVLYLCTHRNSNMSY